MLCTFDTNRYLLEDAYIKKRDSKYDLAWITIVNTNNVIIPIRLFDVTGGYNTNSSILRQAGVAYQVTFTASINYISLLISMSTDPIRISFVKLIYNVKAQSSNLIKHVFSASTGKGINKYVNPANYVSARNSTNLIIDIPCDFDVDSNIYLEVDIAPNSQSTFLFYYKQFIRSDYIKSLICV